MPITKQQFLESIRIEHHPFGGEMILKAQTDLDYCLSIPLEKWKTLDSVGEVNFEQMLRQRLFEVFYDHDQNELNRALLNLRKVEPYNLVEQIKAMDALREAAIKRPPAYVGPWQPIETAPHDEPIDLYAGRRETFCEFLNGVWFNGYGIIVKAPTHWMRIPPAPTKEKGRQ